MRLVESLLPRIALPGDDIGFFERGERFGAAPLVTPSAHPRRDRRAIVGARLVVGEALVGKPMVFADHLAPPPEHRQPDHRCDNPAIRAAIDIAWRVVETAVDRRDSVDTG